MENETADQVQSRHRKEQKELQGHITSKKKNATKKTRKGVNDECAELERQLKERQAEEWAKARGGVNPEGSDVVETDANRLGDQVEDVETKLASTSLSPPHSASEQPQAGGAKKRNRQKERLARRAAEAEAAADAAHAEASTMVDRRGIEAASLAATFREKGLTQHDIVPDGHCLFAAVADQLTVRGMEVRTPQLAASEATDAVSKDPPYRTVRHAAASWMTNHPDDFAPFLDEGETLEAHVKSIRDTAEWGGMLELNALAHAYGVEIRVVQDGRTEVIQPGTGSNDGGENKVLWLAYYRHGYGLGEHYNSLRSAEAAAAS